MSSSSPKSGRGRREVLPPLSEILPEMHNTPPNPDRQYATSLDHSPIGPTTRTAVSGLAPSPLASSSSRARPQYADHLSHHSDSFGSSTYSERPSSYVSQGSSSSRAPTARSSPALPPVQSMALSDRNRNLPPINTYGDSIRSSDPRYTTPPQSARYPGPSYGGVPAQDYGQYSSRASYSSTPSSYGPLNFDNLSDYGDGNKKRRRGNLPKQVTDILRSWFTDHIAHPYPTEDEKIGLMHLTGLTMSQISNWFINARRRNLPQMTRQAQAEAELRENQSNRLQRSQTNR